MLVAVLGSLAKVLEISPGLEADREGRMVLVLGRTVRAALAEGLHRSRDVSDLVVEVLEVLEASLGEDRQVSRPALYSTLATDLQSSCRGLLAGEEEEERGGLLMVRILQAVSTHLIEEKEQVEQEGALILHLVRRVRRHLRSGDGLQEVVEVAVAGLEEDLGQDKEVQRPRLYLAVVEAASQVLAPSPGLAMLEAGVRAVQEGWTGGQRKAGGLVRAVVATITHQLEDLSSASYESGGLISNITRVLATFTSSSSTDSKLSSVMVSVCSAILSSYPLPPDSGSLATAVMVRMVRTGTNQPGLLAGVSRAITARLALILE